MTAPGDMYTFIRDERKLIVFHYNINQELIQVIFEALTVECSYIIKGTF